ncbi:MAG: hypothetical protein V1891_05040 [bacterium]
MRQFVIPQFIDVETKIIGPITVRQFLIMLVDGLIIFITYKLSDFGLFVFAGLSEFMIGGTLAFLKINGRPVHYFLINFIETIRKPKLKVWHKNYWNNKDIYSLMLQPKDEIATIPIAKKELISKSRLSQLSLIIDTGGAYKGEDE